MKKIFLLISVMMSTSILADKYLVSVGYSTIFSKLHYEEPLNIDYNNLITFSDELVIDLATIYYPSQNSIFSFEFGPRLKSMSGKTFDIGFYGRACLVTFNNMNFFIGGVFSWGNDWGGNYSTIDTSLGKEKFTVYRNGSSTYHEGGAELGFNFPVFSKNIEFEVRANFTSRVFNHELITKSLSFNLGNIFNQLDAQYHDTVYDYETLTFTLRYIFK